VKQRPVPTHRSDYPYFDVIPTRWQDNDMYGHVNNVVYYSYFDTAVTRNLMDNGIVESAQDSHASYVVESSCTYFSPVSFPDTVHVGVKIMQLGNSSVRYEIALFQNDAQVASAVGTFVHVYVNRATGRPVPIPEQVRSVLQTLVAAS